nr:aminoglycoside phosphotransferase family protein [Streptomyces bicolor]
MRGSRYGPGAATGAVHLLAEDPQTGTLLLERLDEDRRPLLTVPDVMEATRILAELLARLTAVPAPSGLRRLDAVVARLFERLPPVLAELQSRGADDDIRLLKDCAAAVREVADETGDRLLHWDLHFENVLAATVNPGRPSTRSRWPGTRASSCCPPCGAASARAG